MPSVSKKQAHYMSALDHGWSPPGKHPSRKVAHEFHEADKRRGKWEHATGGPVGVSPLASVLGSGNPLGVAHMGNPGNAFSGMTHFHAPRIPIADTMRNIDQHIGGAAIKLPHIGQSLAAHGLPKPKLAKGGQLDPQMVQALRAALLHLAAIAGPNASRTPGPGPVQSAVAIPTYSGPALDGFGDRSVLRPPLGR